MQGILTRTVFYCSCKRGFQWQILKSIILLIKSLFDRIPRRAYLVRLEGIAGYITFDFKDIEAERECMTEADENPNDITYDRVWRSPAYMRTQPEFQGW